MAATHYSTVVCPMKWLGAWDTTLPYNPGDVVSYSGQLFVALAANTGSTPVDGSTWNILALITVAALGTAGAVLADGTVPFTGAPIIRVNAAPADGALAAGDMAIWYDDTNGAGKFMVKAKQADGTVKTGSFAVNT